jgi:hypothetical protein
MDEREITEVAAPSGWDSRNGYPHHPLNGSELRVLLASPTISAIAKVRAGSMAVDPPLGAGPPLAEGS